MLRPDEKSEIMKWVDRCANREGDSFIVRGATITRRPTGDIVVVLDSMVLDLEPELEDGELVDTHIPPSGFVGGVGWPE